jgi:hypothetical protein
VSKNLPVTRESLSELTGLSHETLMGSFLNIHNIRWDANAESFVQPIESLGYNLILEEENLADIISSVPDYSFSIKVKEPVIEISNMLFNALLFFQKPNWRELLEIENEEYSDYCVMIMPDNINKIFFGNEKILERLGQDFNYDFIILNVGKVSLNNVN